MSSRFPLVEFLVWKTVQATWQATLLMAIAFFLTTVIWRKMPARWQAGLWLIVLARLLIPVLPPSPIGVFNLSQMIRPASGDFEFPAGRFFPMFGQPGLLAEGGSAVAGTVNQAAVANNANESIEPTVKASPQNLSLLWMVVGVWIVGALIVVGRMALVVGRMFVFLRTCREVTDANVIRLFESCRKQLSEWRRVKLVVSPDRIGPAITSLGGRIHLLLPERMLSVLSEEELRLVFLHELAHVRRADVLIECLWTVASAIHWFNPMIWLARSHVRDVRERACDESVLAAIGVQQRFDYGRVLLKVVEVLSPAMPLPATVGALSSTESLKRRIIKISEFRRATKFQFVVPALLLTGLALWGLTDAMGQSSSDATEARVGGVAQQEANGVILTNLTGTIVANEVNGAPLIGTSIRIPKLYLQAGLNVKGDDGQLTEVRGIIEVDPTTGAWRKLVEKGYSPRISPNGETMIYVNDQEIWNCDVKEALNPGKVASGSGKLSWIPDGKSFVVTEGTYIEDKANKENEGWKCESYRISSDTSAKLPIPIPSTDFVEDVSPDGNWVVISSDRHPPKGSGYQLYVMRIDGTEQRRLTKNGLNVYARFSPDGRRIVYVHQRRSQNSLITINVDGTDERTILSENGSLNSAGHSAWSPDGKQIAVILHDWKLDGNGKKFIDASADAHYRIQMIDADGSNGRLIELKDVDSINWLGGGVDWR